MRFKYLVVLALIVALAVACGGSVEPETVTERVEVEVTRVVTETQTETVTETVTEIVTETVVQTVVALPAIDPLAFSGDVVTAGSSTVFPLAERMAERFQDEGFSGNVTIDSIGSGAGFERFCVAGESDIANASRAIKDSEIESCAAIGRTPIEFRVGTDALAVTVSQENDFLTDVTFEQLAAIFSTAETWADVDPSWPAEPILRYIPGTDSGTFDYFVEEVFEEDETPILAASNLELSEDDNVLVQGILGSPYAIGFFGYAYYQENADALTVLSIEGVEASAETVDAGEYPLARPLFMYSDATIMAEKPQVAAYINFFLTYVNEEITDVGYFPASAEALDASKMGWLDAQ
jgi:phosphate transport system substrate-binding protein